MIQLYGGACSQRPRQGFGTAKGFSLESAVKVALSAHYVINDAGQFFGNNGAGDGVGFFSSFGPVKIFNLFVVLNGPGGCVAESDLEIFVAILTRP